VTRTRIEQVTAFLDLQPSPVPGPRGTHQVHHGQTAGPIRSQQTGQALRPAGKRSVRPTGRTRQLVLQRNAGAAASATPAKSPWRRLGTRYACRDCPQIPWAMHGPDRDHPAILLRAGGPLTGPDRQRNRGAGGLVNRRLQPDSVRHMSVTTAMQRPMVAHDDTQRDSTKTAREPGYAQATGRFRR
jgi:hypothetical protein